MGGAKSGGAGYARGADRPWALAATLVALTASPVAAFNARLGWTPVQSTAGYRVYVRQNGNPYGSGIDVGPLQADTSGAVHYIASGLPNGITNFFAVTAYDASSRESALSNELSLLVTATPKATVTPSPAAAASRTASATTRNTSPPTATVAATNTRVPTTTRSFTPTPTRTPAPAWLVSIPTDARAKPGTPVSVPVTITAGSGVRQLALGVAFDANVVAVQAVQLSAGAGAGTLAAGFATPGSLTVAATLLQPMTAGGALLDVFYTAVGPCRSSTVLHITSCVLDGGAIGCQPGDGRITVRCRK